MRLFALLIIFSMLMPLAASTQQPAYRNLVFEGGGVRGLAYAGALEALQQAQVLAEIKQTAGTSVGAVSALLVAVGYSPAEIKTIMEDLKIQQFNDGRFIFFGGFYRFFHRYGWYRGERFERWIGKLIEQKTGNAWLTFKQLHVLRLSNKNFRDLYITGTNLTAQRTEIFCLQATPQMPLKTAVRISMSIPLYFSAVLLDTAGNVVRKPKRGCEYSVMIDGGLTANYPVSVFDSGGVNNAATLGLKLERPEQIAGFKQSTAISHYHIKGMSTYVGALYNYIIESLNRDKDLINEKGRTIYISTKGIKPRVRPMRRADKALLYNSGLEAANAFFKK